MRTRACWPGLRAQAPRGAPVRMCRRPPAGTHIPRSDGLCSRSGTRPHQVHVPDTRPRALNHTGAGGGEVEDLGICPPQWPSGKSSRRRAQHLSPGVVGSLRRGLSSSQLYLSAQLSVTQWNITEQPGSQVMDVVDVYLQKGDGEGNWLNSFIPFIYCALPCTRLFSRNT